MNLKKVVLAAVCAVAAPLAHAQTGTLGLFDIGSTTANTGNINTATSFTQGEVLSTPTGTGIFSGLPTQFFGSITFSPSSPTSYSFGNGTFGTFQSSSITVISESPGSVEFGILGAYSAGSFDPGDSGPASVLLTFTQIPAGTGSIADSDEFSTPPNLPSTPEPGTLALLGLGAGALGLKLRRRQA